MGESELAGFTTNALAPYTVEDIGCLCRSESVTITRHTEPSTVDGVYIACLCRGDYKQTL